MNGKYEIQIYNNKVHYHLTIKRNITIFQGDSASGKSEMIRLLTAYNNRHESSGVTVISEKYISFVIQKTCRWLLFCIRCYKKDCPPRISLPSGQSFFINSPC